MIKNFILGFLTLLSSASMSIAQLNEEDAKKLQRELEYVHKEADRFRYLMVANEISIRSVEINDKELAALLALQAYNYNVKYKGYERNSNVYFGLSNALKNYGKLPTRLDSNTQKMNGYGKEKMTIDDLKRSESLRKILKRESSRIEQIEFSHSGKLMATVSKDRGIRVWNLGNMNGRPLMISENDSIQNLVFTGDDSQIVCRLLSSSKKEFIVHVWPLNMDKMADQLCSLLSHNMSKDDWDLYIRDGNYEATCKNLPANNK